jgi:hypothetical protein
MHKYKLQIKELDHVEKALHAWEQGNKLCHFLEDTIIKCGPLGLALLGLSPDEYAKARSLMKGSVANHMHLREDLLKSREITAEKYGMGKQVMDLFFNHAEVFAEFPFVLGEWYQKSRRTYCLTPDLQKLLEITGIGSTSFKDLHPPFNTMVIKLSIPIHWKFLDDEGDIDTLIVSIGERLVKIIAFGSDLDEKMFLTPKQLEKMDGIRTCGDVREARLFLKELNHGYYMVPNNHMLIMPNNDEPIEEDVFSTPFNTRFNTQDDQVVDSKEMLPDSWKLIIRIVTSLCLHLEQIRSSTKVEHMIRTSDWRGLTISDSNPKSVLDRSLVSTVSNVHLLTPEEHDFHDKIRRFGVRKASSMVSCHFRGAHWRRPPGKGDDPTAPKSVFVKSAIVNRHRIEDGNIPNGHTVLVQS